MSLNHRGHLDLNKVKNMSLVKAYVKLYLAKFGV